jgi:anionic cell wall polymer biosynthesis LytR-Cps2A-Psr (LCP) family protein
VDFAGFQTVIDSIGGLDLELTYAEAEYLNRRGNWDFNDASAGTWDLVAGMNRLTGEQAFAYSRIRDLDSDLGRSNRQRYVLTRLMEEAEDMSATKLLSLLNASLPMFSTDMENDEILKLAAELIPLLSDLKVVSQRIPADGAFSVVNIDDNGIIKNVLLMNDDDLKENMKLLREAMGAK